MRITQKGKKGASKLTLADVVKIRRLYEEGYTQSALGKRFRVVVGTVGKIVRDESWLEETGARKLSEQPPQAVNVQSVDRLREQGYCVVVFNPEELEGADPKRVADAMIEHAWDVISKQPEA